jgi:hypothetical protein
MARDLPPFDPRVPSPARMWNFWLGGQDTGLPTSDNTHDVAQRVASEAKIVYADYGPMVVSHAACGRWGERAGLVG